MTALDLGWIVTLVLMAGIASVQTRAWVRRRRCAREGHRWQAGPTYWQCQRCPMRRDVGDPL